MQWVLNNFFFGLLFLVMESSVAYMLQDYGMNDKATAVDYFAAIFEFLHMLTVLCVYFNGSGTIVDRLCFSCFKRLFRYD
jgi:hypothetical protein